MICILFLLLFAPSLAEWPPKDCDESVGKKGNSILLSSKTLKSQDVSCRIGETYESSVFVRFERIIPQKGIRSKDDSQIIIQMSSVENGRALSFIRIRDDSIQLDDALSPLKTPPQCVGSFTSQKNQQQWLKFRMYSIPDVGKTIVSIYLPEDNIHFKSCASIELDGSHASFRVNIEGSSSIGMDQWIHSVQTEVPVLMHKKTKIDQRMLLVEKRLSLLESLVSDQITSHVIRHRTLQKDLYMQKDEFTAAKSLSHSRTKIHFAMSNALIIFVAVALLYYIKVRLKFDIPKIERHIL